MIEKVHFLHLQLKVSKSAIKTQQKYPYRYLKNAEFYANYKFVDGALKKDKAKKI
jgi:hypothetical protein